MFDKAVNSNWFILSLKHFPFVRKQNFAKVKVIRLQTFERKVLESQNKRI